MKRKLFVVLAVLVALAFCLPAFGVDLYPTRNNDGRIGKSGKAWGLGYFYDLYVQDDLTVTDDVSVGGDAVVDGNASFNLGAAAHELAQISETWTLSAAEMICTLLTTTSGSSDATIIAPDTAGRLYVLRNASNAAVTIKKSGGTGVSVAAGKTAIVIHNGTNYVRVTGDATH